ncbi:hypothetical protein WEU32_06900 [Brevundimonas sp. BH3]|uniref:phage nozzle protein n=1 Tax=Brevundimonas sp. BH3 TaxID=3133089 RepID=UPI00324B1E44
MSLVTRSIPTLLGGVSQQSPEVRAPEQLESCENAWADLARGLAKRAPTENIAKIFETAPTAAFVHNINRDVSERYIVIVSADGLKVFDLEGNEKTVHAPAGWAYLDGITDYRSGLSMMTVADYTFVVNRKMICEMAPLGADKTADPIYHIWLNRGHGTDANGQDFAPAASYSYDPNPADGSLAGTVQRFDKLPETANEGAVYRIQGDESSGFISYYVRRSGGVWDECLKPNMVNAIKARSMPHALISNADGTFTFAPFSWAPRRVGDETINPQPAFIGRSIQKVFFYQNRLSFLVDENVVMSVSGDFGNFWRMSQLDYLASDVIDIAATSTKVAKLIDATTHNDGILLTSDQTQFSLTNGELGVSAETLAVRPTTNYVVNQTAGLCPLGSEIYFAVDGARSAQIREYTRLAGSDATTAADVTSHVDRYIPNGVHKIVAADDLNALFVLTSGEKDAVFVYQFYWATAQEKAQSAWHKWKLSGEIISAEYISGYLYLCMARTNGVFLERINLKPAATSDETANQIYLDRQDTVTGEYDPVQDKTYFSLSYLPLQSRFKIVKGDGFADTRETLIDPQLYEWDMPNRVAVVGQHQQHPCVVGENYTMQFEFSTQYVRNARGEAMKTGRTQLRTFEISYRDTGYFKTIVDPHGLNNPSSEEIVTGLLSQFTGKTVGQAHFKLNTPAYSTGTHSFAVLGQNTSAKIKIENDSHVSSVFVSAEWEANYHNRSRSI